MSEYPTPEHEPGAVNGRAKFERLGAAHELAAEITRVLNGAPGDVALTAMEMLRHNATTIQAARVRELRMDYGWPWGKVAEALDIYRTGSPTRQAVMQRFAVQG